MGGEAGAAPRDSQHLVPSCHPGQAFQVPSSVSGGAAGPSLTAWLGP